MRKPERERNGIEDAVAAKRLVKANPDAVAATVTVSVIDVCGFDLRNRRFCDVDVCPVDALVLCDG